MHVVRRVVVVVVVVVGAVLRRVPVLVLVLAVPQSGCWSSRVGKAGRHGVADFHCGHSIDRFEHHILRRTRGDCLAEPVAQQP